MEELMILFKNGMVTFPIRFSFSVDYKSFCRKLFEDIVCENFTLFYTIPGHDRCVLRNQEELEIMFALAQSFSLKVVNVWVEFSEKACTSAKNASNSNEEDEVHGEIDKARNSVQKASTSNIDSGVFEKSVFANEDEVIQNEDNQVVFSECSSSRDTCLLSSRWSTLITDVGQVFEGGVSEFRTALIKFSIEIGFNFDYVKNTSKKVVAVCSNKFEEGCEWKINAVVSDVNGFCQVTKFNKVHKCSALRPGHDVRRLKSDEIAALILGYIRSNPDISGRDVKKLFGSSYGMDISYKKAWKGLCKAKGMIYGNDVESFKLLRPYVECALRTNPGSHIVLDVDDTSKRFRRIFIAFGACIEGFRFCRPMLFVDGTFLKGRFKGVMLSATGKDGNQGM